MKASLEVVRSKALVLRQTLEERFSLSTGQDDDGVRVLISNLTRTTQNSQWVYGEFGVEKVQKR